MSIILNGTAESIRITLDASPATNQCPATINYGQVAGSLGDATVLTNGTTPAVLLTGVAAAPLVVNSIQFPNVDTAQRILSVTKVTGAGTFVLFRATLPVGFSLYYDSAGGWYCSDNLGNRLTSLNAPGRLLGFQVFTGSGTYTPSTGTNSIVVTVVGGGGGSGACPTCSAAQGSAAGGGGGGGAAQSRITSGFAGTTVTIGAGGTAGAAGSNAGGTGGTTSFGAFLSATGGAAGGAGVTNGSITVTNGASSGGIGSGGNIWNISGNSSSVAYVLTITSTVGGAGGNSYLGGGGAQRASLGGPSAGAPGGNYGGGASGTTIGAPGAATAGAVGGGGICIVEEYA